VPREAITKNADWTQPDTILTDGPWALKDWTHGAALDLVRNPVWPDAPIGNLTDISIGLTANASADFTRVDLAAGTAIPAGFTVQSAPDASVVLGFSGENTLIKNDAVRHALAFAIDRSALVKALPAGTAIAASRFAPTGTADNSGFAPDAAKTALAASPIPACNRLPDKLTLAVEDSPAGAASATTLISGWNAVLGCNPTSFTVVRLSADALQKIAHAEVNSDLSSNGAPRPLLWIATWRAEYPDANAWAGDALHCQFGFMRTYSTCGDAETQIDLAGKEADPGKRAAEYVQAETTWFSPTGSFPVAPLYTTLAARAHQPWLTNIADAGALRFDQWQAAAHG
jgi:ABC-type oligopeptide transport system substrate-binding subunit